MNKITNSLFFTALFFGTLIAAAPAPTLTAAPASRLKTSGHLNVGFTANPQKPRDHQNFGRLFDDRANEPLLNQLVFTIEQPLATDSASFDWGFKLQGLYGSDARFIHSTGLLDQTTTRLLQPDLVEAFANLHFAVAGTSGGIDLKIGKFVTLEGAEVIPATGNAFYSHAYLFNFGVPFNHTGVLATIHATKDMDLMLGLVRGVNTTRDNNGRLSFHGGISWPGLLDGKLAVLATTHIGPETPNDQKNYRYLNDVVAIYKATDRLTVTTDLNYIQDDAARAKGYGIAQYFSYVVDEKLTANFRGELWRDNHGFYVAQIANNVDLLSFQRGDAFTPDPRTVGGGVTTYGALTAGLTWKASNAVTVRVELRYDRSLNGTTPFADSSRRDSITGAIDMIWAF